MTTRRAFIQVLAASGGALALGVGFGRASESDARPFSPNAWLTIHPDGSVVIRVGKSEMGQGVRTSLPMIVAEELDADLSRVKLEQASPGPDFPGLGTGGSGSIVRSWDPLRVAGAAARAMLVSAAAARWNVEAGTVETRDGFAIHAPSGRRASYGDLAGAAATLPVPEKPELKSRSTYRLIGKPQRRLDGPEIVTGRAKYGLDVRLPGMRFAVVARSPQLGGKLESFDAQAAKKVSGVVGVFEIPSGVAVVAENSWAALRGREALVLKWAPSPHAAFDSDRHREALARAVEEPGVTIRKVGQGREGFAKAASVVDAVYSYPFAAHASVEPVNSTAPVQSGRCTVWSPTQAPNAVQAAGARVLSIPEGAVSVNVMLLGGGFGRRLGVDFDVEAIEIARRVEGTPVQLLWSRDDDMRHGYFQAATAERLRAGLDPKGKVLAFEHRKASTLHNARRTLTAEEKANPETLAASAWGVNNAPWIVADAEMSYRVVDAPVPIGPWRSVYSPSSVFARECFLDEVAHAAGKDPLALRLELLEEAAPEKENAAPNAIDRSRMRRVLEVVAAKSGWGGKTKGGIARGLAANVFHARTYVAYVVEVSLRPSGQLPFTVERVVCALDLGVAINPLGIEQQVESGIIWSLSNMKSEITMKEGAIVQSHFADFPVVMIDETPARIETHIVPSDDERPRGLGEPTVCPFAPAVVNALSLLAGKRIRRLPVRAADLRAWSRASPARG